MAEVVNGIPLVFVVLGLTEFVKKAGIKGNAALVASLVIGAALGVGYQVSVAMPTDFAGWFAAVVSGLMYGLTASGLYDYGKKHLLPKPVA